MTRRVPVRGSLVTGSLVLAVVMAAPVLSAPTPALADALDPKTALAEVEAAAVAAQDALLAGGGRTTATTGQRVGPRRTVRFESERSVDVTRKTVRHRTSSSGLSSRGERRYFGQVHEACDYGGDDDRDRTSVQIDRAGVGSFTRIGRGTSFLRAAGRMVDRPDARWKLDQRRVSIERSVRRGDPVLMSLAVLSRGRLVSATRTPQPGGVRYEITHEVPGSFVNTLGTVTVDLDASGRAVRLTETEEDRPATVVTHVFGAQKVLAPRRADAVTARALTPGCRAVATERGVRDLVRQSAWTLHPKQSGRRATVARLRADVRSTRTNDWIGLDLRLENVPAGIRVTGRHRLLERPVTREVVVRFGRPVVRP